MRKIWVIVLSAATVLCVGATSAFAVNVGQGQEQKTSAGAEAAASGEISGVIQTADVGKISCYHEDADHDGICDGCGEVCEISEADQTGCHDTDADSNGICDICGNSCSYTDGNPDGVCGNPVTATGTSVYGHHHGGGGHHGHGGHGCGR